jgi:hypothetical protein
MQTSGAMRRGTEECVLPSLRNPILSFGGAMDCFAFARNDGHYQAVLAAFNPSLASTASRIKNFWTGHRHRKFVDELDIARDLVVVIWPWQLRTSSAVSVSPGRVRRKASP